MRCAQSHEPAADHRHSSCHGRFREARLACRRMSGDIVIVGTGGHGREVLDVLEALQSTGESWRVLGFLDDSPARHGRTIRGLPVLGGIAWLADCDADQRPQAFLGIGAAGVRLKLASQLASLGVTSPALVHPRATVTPHVTMGEGVLVTAGSVITSDVTIGAHSFLNVGASVSHDGAVGRFCSIQMGARLSGAVTLGDGVEIGVGAVVRQNIEIGEWTVIGAGAAVVRSIPCNVVAVGVPARVTETREPGWQLA